MPVYKPDLSRLSIVQLSDLTRKDKATVAKRLREVGLDPCGQDGKTTWYRPWEALPILYGGVAFDPQRERARLDAVRREKAELELAVIKREQMPLADHEKVLVTILGGVTQRMRAIPSRSAPVVRAAETDEHGEAVLRDDIERALGECAAVGEELGRRALELSSRITSGGSHWPSDDEADTESDGERVGGFGAPALPGEQRGAWTVEDE